MTKKRLDIWILERGLAPSRERARALIMEGRVFIRGQREDKCGTQIPEDKAEDIEIRGEDLPYVSRGGLKLEKAFRVWPLQVRDSVCLDIGASTGGFTDVLLQQGAARVYAVDSGTGQLAYSLRRDDRVICMEKTNFRYVTEADFPEHMDFACADVSFISLSKILMPAYRLLKTGASMVCLVKPQFEAGRAEVGKKGVVKDPSVHERVLHAVCGYATEAGFSPQGLDFSPVRGPEGNIEYLLYLVKESGDAMSPLEEKLIGSVVSRAKDEAK